MIKLPLNPSNLHCLIISSLKFHAKINIISGSEFIASSALSIDIDDPGEYKSCFKGLLSAIADIFVEFNPQ